MKEFVHTDEFKALNVGFSLDEGVASESDVYNVYYAERAIWRNSPEKYQIKDHFY